MMEPNVVEITPMLKPIFRRERLLGFCVGVAVCILVGFAERLFNLAGF